MRSSATKIALILSACCVFSAFAASCSEKTSKKDSKSGDEPETQKYSCNVSPEDFSAEVFSGINRDGLYGEFDTLFSAAGAENPFVSNIGYMIDDDVLNISMLGNDDPFNSFNHMLSSATGNTPDYNDNFVPKSYFKAVDVTYSYNEDIVSLEEYDDHIFFQCKPGSGDAYVDVDLTMPEDGELCFHIGGENFRQYNVWLSNHKEGGDFTDFESLGSYGGDGKGHVLDAGTFKKGEDVKVRFSILPDDGMRYSGSEYLMVNSNSGFNFYYADETAVNGDLEQFAAQPFVLDEEASSYEKLVGTVTAGEGKILMTCLPYDTEHKITVDGEKLESLVDDKLNNGDGDRGEVVVFGEFIGLKLPEGDHEIEIRFTEKYDKDEYRAVDKFAELFFEGDSTDKMLEIMFPDDLISEADKEELTDYFYYASASFEDMYPDCKLISRCFRRLRKADEQGLENISRFYDLAYENFGVEHDEVSLRNAGIYLLILEYENSSGETKRAYHPVSAAEIDGKWCVYFA